MIICFKFQFVLENTVGLLLNNLELQIIYVKKIC